MFYAIDVETANVDVASICQIGIVKFDNANAVGTWESLVNPEDYFDPINIFVHGICENDVLNSPTFPMVEPEIRKLLTNQVVVCHTHFDRLAISRVFEKYGLDVFPCIWLDTARVARRTWKEFAYSGYGLSNLASYLNIKFQHHDALEDARAAGEILVRAMNETNIPLVEWLKQVEKPIFGSANHSVKREGNPDGLLYGEEIVFTGTLSIPRHQAVDLASQAGCNVGPAVTKKTTILVVGDQNTYRLAGYEKSSKHRKAELLIREGQSIQIISEDDFFRLIE